MINPENKGERVTSLAQLYQLSIEKRAVFTDRREFSHKPFPAAFVINMSGVRLHSIFNSGLYVYEKVKK